MPPSDVPTATLALRDFHALAPEIVLAFWGLVVLMADLTLFGKMSVDGRRKAAGRLTLVGIALALAAAFVPLFVRYNIYGYADKLNFAGFDYLASPDPSLFFGTLSDDLLTESFNLVFLVLLGLVTWMSTSWSFTESWGEYFALLLWSAVGMMLLSASEDLIMLFLTLEMMTICLYLNSAFEKTRRRSAEAGLKYFVYGSVSSALFLFGLSLIYGLTGSTRFEAIFEAMPKTFSGPVGLPGNLAGMTAVLLLLVGFGFKVAAVPFHQWAPDAYEGAPAPVTAWIATGSKIASLIAMMKVFLHALLPWQNTNQGILSPGWVGLVVILSAASMTFGNFAALAQRNLKRMLAYSSIAHAGYMLVGVAAAAVSARKSESTASVLYYLIIYSFSNIGAFAVAAWLARDKQTDDIDDLNGLAYRYPVLSTCILLLMLSLIGMPPLAGFFGKLYMFMEALNEGYPYHVHLALMWLVALGLLNSVVSAFYYVRVLKAMFLRPAEKGVLSPPPSSIAFPIVLATAVVIGFGIYPAPLVELMRGASVPMLMPGDRPGFIKHDSSDEPPAPPQNPSSPPASAAGNEAATAAKTKGRPAAGEANPPAPTPVPARKP